MSTHLLSRHSHRPRASLSLLTRGAAITPAITLERGRAHEACGPARRSFALWLAASTQGPVLWITPQWQPVTLNPDGMMDFADPARFLFVAAPRREDQLWAIEEALRSGAAPLVVADLEEPPAMTPVRRLHLAAEQGGSLGVAPLALLLTPGSGGAAGIESRWHMSPAHQGRQRIWQLDRLRARTQPPACWRLQQKAPRSGLQLCPAPQADLPSEGPHLRATQQ
ncbi:hypothetical protein [Pseudophaeobacter sp.]|uniref:ImuA family protein n=1 Tax=Pseudophaeobacter sp. TaxID=1971739 RepID=UPI0032973DBA